MPGTKRITITDCREAIRLSECVYWREAEATAEALAMGFSEVEHIGNNGGPHAMICGDASRVIVVIRGTEISDLYDVITDGRWFPRMDYQGGFVHRGFHDYCEAIWLELEPLILMARGRDLLFTGHSLGGICALIFGTWSGILRRAARAPLADVITVGAPMGGTARYCRAMENQTTSITRITNNLDPVTLWNLWPLYRHPKCERLHILASGRVVRNPTFQDRLRNAGQSLWKSFWAVLWNSIRHRGIIRGLAAGLNEHDHFVKNYRRKFDGYFESKNCGVAVCESDIPV